MDREQIKQVILQELNEMGITDVILRNVHGYNARANPEEFAERLAQKLYEEAEWNARVSAGYDPDRQCPQCHGPIEADERADFGGWCEKCGTKALLESEKRVQRRTIQHIHDGKHHIQEYLSSVPGSSVRVERWLRETIRRFPRQRSNG